VGGGTTGEGARMVDVIVAVIGVALVVLGVALWSVPAALVVAGMALVAIAVLFDLPARRRPDRSTR
jgi:hypothetical protein